MPNEFLSHHGVKGQQWYHRYHQSYETVPTRSGKVGQEHLTYKEFKKKNKFEGKEEYKEEKKLGENTRSKDYMLKKFKSALIPSLITGQQRDKNGASKIAFTEMRRNRDYRLNSGDRIRRVSADKDELDKADHLYVTLEDDLDSTKLYESKDFLKWIQGNYPKEVHIHRNTYEFNTDIRVASANSAAEVMSTITNSNKKVWESVGVQYVRDILKSYNAADNMGVLEIKKLITPSSFKKMGSKDQAVVEKEKKRISKTIQNTILSKTGLIDNYDYLGESCVKAYSDWMENAKDINWFNNNMHVHRAVYDTFASDNNAMKALISDLKKKGYSAYMDPQDLGIDAKSPMVIIDLKTLNKIKSEQIADGFSGDYLAHFGKKGQKWYHRFFQSYETAPTRSGKVGQEHGKAAESRSRQESKEEILKDPQKLLDHFDDFTPEEINKALQNFQKKQQIKTFIPQKKEEKKELTNEQKKILKDPKLLNKHIDEFTSSQIEEALKYFDQKKRVQDASIDNFKKLAKWGEAGLGYWLLFNKIVAAEKTTKNLFKKQK